MAETVGFLREDSTYGEKLVLKLLRTNLPKEYTVYIETPIRKKREIRYPDFIVLTNYGVLVLEVKDWVHVLQADPNGARILTRKNEKRWEQNPVTVAREYAIALANELNSKCQQRNPGETVPWSYAAALINLPVSVITQIRQAWGEEFVLSKADLENSSILKNRLKNTFAVHHMRDLTRFELDQVRATIFPVVEIDVPGLPTFILDEQQERIVAETIRPEPGETQQKETKPAVQDAKQTTFIEETIKEETEKKEPGPVEGELISRNVAIRLVRGFSGSGKTLVLMQRARFLAAQYPEWKIGVLTYNKPLQQQLQAAFRGTNIQARTFHNLCCQYISTASDGEVRLDNWLKDRLKDYPDIKKLNLKQVSREIDWLREVGVSSLEEYLAIERRGIGKDGRLLAPERREIYSLLEDYQNFLKLNNKWDWVELPNLTLQVLKSHPVNNDRLFDAILVDEAQDWAPVWFEVIKRLIHPDHGLMFLVDDPSQSIYRYFSWKEKGVGVVGRTRWLRVPYRNTYEIYRAAYSLIADNQEIQQSLAEEGELVVPELSSQAMRHGPLPLLRKCKGQNEELEYLKSLVDTLRQEGYSGNQISVLLRFKADMKAAQSALKGTEVESHMIHSYKGLETEVVIIPFLQKTFPSQVEPSKERRLLYMAFSRARSRLYLTYSGKLPPAYDMLRRQELIDYLD